MGNEYDILFLYQSTELHVKQMFCGNLPLREAFPCILKHFQVSWRDIFMVTRKPHGWTKVN
jgi:hypothetical protein